MNILEYPHPMLRYRFGSVLKIDHSSIKKMFDLMRKLEGYGLSANQVGLPYRLFITSNQVFINPAIIQYTGLIKSREGCLSLPGIVATVERYSEIMVKAYDETGNVLFHELEGIDAVLAQHEMDHVNGILFIDRLTGDDRLAITEDLDALEQKWQSH